jgi:hypothetical protein
VQILVGASQQKKINATVQRKEKMAIVWPNDLPARSFDYAGKISSAKQFDLGVALGCLLFAMSCSGVG